MILAGPGDVGKSTAAARLPRPWRALSDDMCLISRSVSGDYWAHPWPTFSLIRMGRFGGAWVVENAVPLKIVCMLAQHKRDQLQTMSYYQAVSELVDISGQTTMFMTGEMEQNVARRVNLMRFHNALLLAKEIPVYRLMLSLKGKFWKEIEKLAEIV